MTGKKYRRAVYCIMGLVLLGLGLGGLLWAVDSAFVKEAPYDVKIAGSPEIRGTLYTMGEQRYLLVLSVPGTSTPRGFIVNLQTKEMGFAFLPRYSRFGRFALVDRETLEGYCVFCAGLAADFSTSGDSTIITATGFISDSAPPDEDTKSFLLKMLIYEERIILKPMNVRESFSIRMCPDSLVLRRMNSPPSETVLPDFASSAAAEEVSIFCFSSMG